jgi:hypothetical protein
LRRHGEEVLEVLALARVEEVRPVLDSARRVAILLTGLIREFS